MKLIRHSFYNIMGLGLPLLVAVFSIPVLIHALGEARFGLLTLIWAVVSYFGLFDLGLGRALTQKLAVELSREDHSSIGPLVATSTVLMAALGVFAGLLMAALAPWGVGLIQDVPNQQEAINAVYWMAAAMPAIVLTSGFRGILEAHQAFAIVNLIRLPMGIFTFLGPLLVVHYGVTRLDLIALVLAIGRVAACVVHGWYAWRLMPIEIGGYVVQRMMVKPLCVSGGWMTVSNVVGPLMGYLDRFVLGAFASAAAVAYYVTPQEIIFKITILPSALMFVLFPYFSKLGSNFRAETINSLSQSATIIGIICVPVVAFFSLFSAEILSVWINQRFAMQGAEVMVIMACGMLINSFAFLPLTWLQASGNPKIVAYIHVFELPISCFVLWFGIIEFGIIGAAMAWLFRIVLDASLLWLFFAKMELGFSKLAKKYISISLLLAAVVYIVTLFQLSIVTRFICMAVLVIISGRELFVLLGKDRFRAG